VATVFHLQLVFLVSCKKNDILKNVNFLDLTTELNEPHFLDIEKKICQIINEVGYFCNIAARQVTGHGLKKGSPLVDFLKLIYSGL
jgi:hypothetical protein